MLSRIINLVLFGFVSLTFAIDEVKPIHKMSGDFYPDLVKVEDMSATEKSSFGNNYIKLLQFKEIPNASKRSRWENAGLSLVDYLPDDTYFAVIKQSFDLSQIANDVITIVDVPGLIKMESSLYDHYIFGQSTSQLVLSYYFGIDPDQVIDDLTARRIYIEEHRKHSRQLEVRINPDQFEEIIALPYIQFAGLPLEEPELEGYFHNSTGRANYLNTGYNGLIYDGSGVTIAVGESGTADNRINFKGRLTEMVSDADPGDHKINCLRYAAGGGNAHPTDYHNASGATLLSLPSGPDYTGLYDSHALRFTNHSFGWGVGGGYNQTARNHDLRTASHPLAIVSYSSGNVGGDGGYAPYDGFTEWANITGPSKHNKNHFAIRNLNESDAIITWGSKGPAYDGRILPQLTIEGSGGTSYASPKIVGLMAIMAEAYKDLNAGSEAPANLLRAIMMNTADDMDDPGPDFKTGYGRPNMRRAYNVINNNQFLTGTVDQGGSVAHQIAVPSNATQLRVMLMWPDVAASVDANPAIVNNLNIQVIDPGSSTTYNPWVLDHSADPVLLDLPATRQVDNLNTMEQVTVDFPASGTWSVEVSGANVPMGPQTYYLVYEFLTDELHMAFPLSGVQFESDEAYTLKWDSYGSSSSFDLEYELDENGTWYSVVSNVENSLRAYRVGLPSFGEGIRRIRFRVSRDGLTAESGVCFIGAVPQAVTAEWSCDDITRLSWDPVAGATSYNLYRVMDEYMELVNDGATFDGTSALISVPASTQDEYFAVSALTGSYEGMRSPAVLKPAGDYNCVSINTSIASAINNADIQLNGLVNPHNSTLTDVHFEYGPTTEYGFVSPNITISATGHTEEWVSSIVSSPLTSRNDLIHYRLSGVRDGLSVYGDDQEVRLAPGFSFTSDGVDDYLDFSAHPDLPIYKTGSGAAYSFTMWVNGPAQNDNRVYAEGSNLSDAPVFFAGTHTSGAFRMYLRGDDGSVLKAATSTSIVFDNTWHHIAWIDENGSVKFYVDGIEDATNFSYTPSTLTLNQASIGSILRSTPGNYFDGSIDEISVWDKALSAEEVQNLMHQPLVGDEADLKAYINLDGNSDQIFDLVTAARGEFVGDWQKTSSTIPFGIGSGISYSEAAGIINLSEVDMSANYLSHNNANVIATKIDIEPNTLAGIAESSDVFDREYWIIHRAGSGDFSADLTFNSSEDLTAADEAAPAMIQLYTRDKGSAGDWTFLATSDGVNAASNTATFSGLTEFNKQFILTKNTEPFISTNTSQLPFENSNTICLEQIHSYEVNAVNLTSDLIVYAPTGFLVSLDDVDGYSSSISISPANGILSETIYAKLLNFDVGSYSGLIENMSDGAPTASVEIPEFQVLTLEENASNMAVFDGSNDYLDIVDLDWNPMSVFTIEWWLNPASHINWNHQIGNGWNSFMFHASSDGMFSAGIANNSDSRINSEPGAMILNEWQHFAYTLNGTEAALYQNGELVGETSNSNGKNSSWGHFEIGKPSSGTVNGSLDEFRMWSFARSQAEIQENMHTVLSGDEAGLRVYLQFNAESNSPVDFGPECYTIQSYDNLALVSSSLPIGHQSQIVQTQVPATIGPTGRQLEVSITSTPDGDNYIGIYKLGTGDLIIDAGETFPANISKRSDIIWGAFEYGDVTANINLDYSDVYGVSNPAEIQVLKRADGASEWIDASSEFSNDLVNRSFQKTGETEFAEYSISLNEYPNSAPVWSENLQFSFDEDNALQVNLNDWVSDENDAATTLDISISGGEQIILDYNDVEHTASFSAAPDSSGIMEAFVVTATDPYGLSGMDSLWVEVLPRNDAPTLMNPLADILVNEDAADVSLDLTGVFSDVDIQSHGDNLTFSVVSTNAGVVMTDLTEETITLYFQADQYGSGSLIITAIDDSSASTSDTLNFLVNPINDPPEGTVAMSLWDIDEDAYAAVVIPRLEDYFDDVDTTDHLIFSGEILGEGLDSIQFGGEGAFIQLLMQNPGRSVLRGSITNPVTHAVRDVWKAGNENKLLNGLNQDGNPQQFLTSLRENDSTAIVVYPSLNFNGQVPVLVTATDDSSASYTDTLFVNVVPINDAPIIATALGDIEIEEDTDIEVSFWATDADDDGLSYSVSTDSSALEVVYTDSMIQLSPAENWFGTASVFVAVSDAEISVNDTFTVIVNAVNDAPTVSIPLWPPLDTLFADPADTVITFVWGASMDVEGAEIEYTLRIESPGLPSTIYETGDTSLAVNITELTRNDTSWWEVTSSDGELQTPSEMLFFFVDAAVGIDDWMGIPMEYALNQNYPNPFNPTTTLRYGLPESSDVKLTIYDLRGREVRYWTEKSQTAGWHELSWNGLNQDGSAVSTGVYLARFQAGSYSSVIKMVYLR